VEDPSSQDVSEYNGCPTAAVWRDRGPCVLTRSSTRENSGVLRVFRGKAGLRVICSSVRGGTCLMKKYLDRQRGGGGVTEPIRTSLLGIHKKKLLMKPVAPDSRVKHLPVLLVVGLGRYRGGGHVHVDRVRTGPWSCCAGGGGAKGGAF